MQKTIHKNSAQIPTKVELWVTDDGSHTLFNPSLNETYHNHLGAVSESKHVFIQAGLEKMLETFAKLSILEVGFGTGLNAFQTLIKFQVLSGISINYQTIEPYPIEAKWIDELNYAAQYDEQNQAFFKQLHHCSWNQTHQLMKSFNFNKFLGSLQEYDAQEGAYNLIYFDAFAPNKQPDIWNIAVFEKCYRLLSEGGMLVSYCANGQFKRNLKAVGFIVKVCPGALGKREMTRAWKL